ncbi:MAG: hypothetical protein FWG36_01300 [Oscillospiraceae bacterium]|nr:hypothetical protein [Oscillospiraceae bacterium]
MKKRSILSMVLVLTMIISMFTFGGTMAVAAEYVPGVITITKQPPSSITVTQGQIDTQLTIDATSTGKQNAYMEDYKEPIRAEWKQTSASGEPSGTDSVLGQGIGQSSTLYFLPSTFKIPTGLAPGVHYFYATVISGRRTSGDTGTGSPSVTSDVTKVIVLPSASTQSTGLNTIKGLYMIRDKTSMEAFDVGAWNNISETMLFNAGFIDEPTLASEKIDAVMNALRDAHPNTDGSEAASLPSFSIQEMQKIIYGALGGKYRWTETNTPVDPTGTKGAWTVKFPEDIATSDRNSYPPFITLYPGESYEVRYDSPAGSGSDNRQPAAQAAEGFYNAVMASAAITANYDITYSGVTLTFTQKVPSRDFADTVNSIDKSKILQSYYFGSTYVLIPQTTYFSNGITAGAGPSYEPEVTRVTQPIPVTPGIAGVYRLTIQAPLSKGETIKIGGDTYTSAGDTDDAAAIGAMTFDNFTVSVSGNEVIFTQKNPSTSSNTLGGSSGGGATDGDANGTISKGDAPAPHINLTAETVNAGYEVAAYSIDGGKKWKKGPLPEDKKLAGLFNKGMTLWLTDKYNDKDVKEEKTVVAKKGVADGANVVKFPKIEKRPKANAEKLAPFYYHATPSSWFMTKKGAKTYSEPTGKYEWADTEDGKAASSAWQSLPDVGWTIEDTGTKKTVLFRSAPVADEGKYIPGSKIFKVKPAAYGKAPNYKIKSVKNPDNKDTKLNVLPFKKGDQYLVVGGIGGRPEAWIEPLTAKLDIQVGELGPEGTKVHIRKGATGKKPASAIQEIALPEGIAKIEYVTVTVASDADGVKYTYSQSSLANAVPGKGINLPKDGFSLIVGATIHIHADWDDSGVNKAQQISYKAIGADVDDGKALAFNDWKIGAPKIAAKSQPKVTEKEIIITGSGFKTGTTDILLQNFTIEGSAAGKVTGIDATATEVKFTTTTALASGDKITITAKPAAYSTAPMLNSNTVTFTVDVDEAAFDTAIAKLTAVENKLGEIAALAAWDAAGGPAKRSLVVDAVAAIVGSAVTVSSPATTPTDTSHTVTITSKTKPELYSKDVTVTYTIGS